MAGSGIAASKRGLPSLSVASCWPYQETGNGFAKVDLPLRDPPGRKEDPELKGAVVGHEHIEPLRWESPSVLILQRHDYYEALTGPSGQRDQFTGRNRRPLPSCGSLSMKLFADATLPIHLSRADRAGVDRFIQ